MERSNLISRRNFGNHELLQWEEMVELLRWGLTRNGIFTTSSLYEFCASNGVTDIRMCDLW
jgi:hypothetical protein